jgi:hypothetical protein
LLSRVVNKANSELSWVDCGIHGTGQGFPRVSEQNPIELDRREVGPKVAAPGDYALRSHVREGRGKSIEVGEGLESASGHLDPIPLGSDRARNEQPRPCQDNGMAVLHNVGRTKLQTALNKLGPGCVRNVM